jgi:hypothetical protein
MPTKMLQPGFFSSRYRAMADGHAVPITDATLHNTPLMSNTRVGLIAPLGGVFQGISVPISGGGPPVDIGR